MSWLDAKIQINGVTVEGYVKKERVFCPAPDKFDGISSIKIGGKEMNVLSCELDKRDNFLNIVLAMASTKQEVSDDQPTKGRDTAKDRQ